MKEQPSWGQSLSPSSPAYYRLSKLTTKDVIEAFLHAFEATVVATGWPWPQWVTILGPYLTSPVQVVLKTLPPQDLSDYNRANTAVLNRFEVTLETQRRPNLQCSGEGGITPDSRTCQ